MSPSRTVLITGGNSGIGKAAATQMAHAGATVVVAARNRERGEAAVDGIRRDSSSDAVSLIQMDMSSRESIQQGCEQLRSAGHRVIDALIHNAADFDISRKEPVFSADGFETVWATNHLGPALLTKLLDEELARSEGARVLTVSSQGLMLHPFMKVNLEDPEFRNEGFRVDKAYYHSKLAQVMYTMWLADRWRDTPRTINCIRVTNVRIDMDRYPDVSELAKRAYRIKSRFSITPEQMAEVYTWLALSPEMAGKTGGYYDEKRKQVGAGSYASDRENQNAVMELTARFVPEIQGDVAGDTVATSAEKGE